MEPVPQLFHAPGSIFRLELNPENLIMLDSKGVLHKREKDLNDVKKQFVSDPQRHGLWQRL
jgi:malic enzyme